MVRFAPMSDPHLTLPETPALAAGLSAALAELGRPGPVEIVARRPNPYASTFPSERLTCRLADGTGLELWCKFAAGLSHASFGHRGDVRYEALVYRHVLAPLPISKPGFFGSHEQADGGGTWLFVEVLVGAVELDEAPSATEALCRAAAWLGGFHRAMASRVQEPGLAFLTRYDEGYFRQWPRRTAQLAGHWHARLPWLSDLCERAEAFASELVTADPTVIHGEYVPSNILTRGDVIFPVDWESAAVGLGEIDLASLIDKWPEPVGLDCAAAYRATRWPGGEGAGFERRLDMARLYWDLRWLGDRPEWTTLEKVGPRFEHLRATAARLGLR